MATKIKAETSLTLLISIIVLQFIYPSTPLPHFTVPSPTYPVEQEFIHDSDFISKNSSLRSSTEKVNNKSTYSPNNSSDSVFSYSSSLLSDYLSKNPSIHSLTRPSSHPPSTTLENRVTSKKIFTKNIEKRIYIVKKQNTQDEKQTEKQIIQLQHEKILQQNQNLTQQFNDNQPPQHQQHFYYYKTRQQPPQTPHQSPPHQPPPHQPPPHQPPQPPHYEALQQQQTSLQPQECTEEEKKKVKCVHGTCGKDPVGGSFVYRCTCFGDYFGDSCAIKKPEFMRANKKIALSVSIPIFICFIIVLAVTFYCVKKKKSNQPSENIPLNQHSHNKNPNEINGKHTIMDDMNNDDIGGEDHNNISNTN